MTESCDTPDSPHLLIAGGGSAAFSAAIEAESLGARVTLVNGGLPIGGTCVNVGCVPSKFLLRAADAHDAPDRHEFAGIEGDSRLDFDSVIGQKRELVDELRMSKYVDVAESLEDLEHRRAEAKFVGPARVALDGEVIKPDRVLVATGASPSIPSIDGLENVDYLTNETAFELGQVPDSLAVIGGGYVGLECAQAFSRFGADVTVLDHTEILPSVTDDLSDGLSYYLREEGISVAEGAEVEEVRPDADAVAISVDLGHTERTLEVDEVLVATGRKPNTGRLDLEEAGVKVDDEGFIETDAALETVADGIFAAGDVVGDPMYVYTAAREGEVAARNAVGDDRTCVDYAPLPWVVFTDPQVAGIGYGEQEARAEGHAPESTTLPLNEVPRSIAGRDARGFIKLVRDRETDRLLGGRILAPEGGELLMEIAVAIEGEMTVERLTELMHPYLTLSEGLRLAALTFDREIDQLSCCAS